MIFVIVLIIWEWFVLLFKLGECIFGFEDIYDVDECSVDVCDVLFFEM